jgi:hypothetical protein
MKYLLILFISLIIVFPIDLFAQNIEFEKVLDHKISVPKHANSEAPYFIYRKFQEDKLIRIEDDKVQLFDKDINLLWEVELGNVNTSNGDNYYTTEVTENEIFIFQRGFATFSKKTNSKIHKVSAKGEVNSLDLTGKLDLDGAEALDVIDNKVLLTVTSPEEGKNGYRPQFKIIQFDKDLSKIQNKIDLPFEAEGQKYGYYWSYFGKNNQELVFKTYYSKENGSLTDDFVKGEFYEREIRVNSELNITDNKEAKYETGIIPRNRIIYTVPAHYDTSKYKVWASGWPISPQWYFPIFTSLNQLAISKGTDEPNDIFTEFFQLKSGKSDVSRYRVMLFDVVEDPINGSINVMFHYENHPAFLIILDDNLKVSAYREFKIGYTQYSGRPDLENLAFPCDKGQKELVGKLPSGHKINAFEHSLSLKGKSFYTIVNYAEYQLLFSDNDKAGTTTVYKVVQ